MVRLLDGDDLLDSAAVDWPSIVEQPVADSIASPMGVGDPAAAELQWPAWTTGEEESAVTTTARVITLAPDLRGMLVHQSAGFEHVRRRHYLFTAADSRLARIWTGEEPQGVYWSTVDIADLGDDGRQEILLWQFSGAGDAAASRWDLRVLAWDAEQRTVAPLSAPVPIFAGVVGSYATAERARAAVAEHAGCLERFLVLDGFEPRRYVVAALSTRRQAAEAAVRQAASCAPGLQGRVIERSYTPTSR